jgi:hypothetical protein
VCVTNGELLYARIYMFFVQGRVVITDFGLGKQILDFSGKVSHFFLFSILFSFSF